MLPLFSPTLRVRGKLLLFLFSQRLDTFQSQAFYSIELSELPFEFLQRTDYWFQLYSSYWSALLF